VNKLSTKVDEKHEGVVEDLEKLAE
jgi:uncharacterized protein involved in exopolysaccharide biosynthesis